jgi:hypothetical protein
MTDVRPTSRHGAVLVLIVLGWMALGVTLVLTDFCGLGLPEPFGR